MSKSHPQLSPKDNRSFRGDRSQRFRDDSGQDLAEYAILAVLIAVALVGALTLFGNQLSAIWQSIAVDLPLGE